MRPRVLTSVVAVGAAALISAPLLAMVLGSLRSPAAPPAPGLWPSAPGLDAFQAAFEGVPLARSLWNSAWICAVAVPVSTLTASMAGLAIATASARWRAVLIAGTFVLLTIPVTAIWLTRFLLFKEAGLVGGYLPLLAPALMGGGPLFVLLYADAFRRLPRDVLEAAKLEGAGALGLWWKVAMPMVGATHAAVALLALATFWSNFIDPLLYLQAEWQLTAPVMLRSLELLGSTQWPVLLAGSVVVSAPAVVAFGFAQRALFAEHRGAGWLGR